MIEEMSTAQTQRSKRKRLQQPQGPRSKVQQQANFRRTWKRNHGSQKSSQLRLVCLALWAVHFADFLATLPLWSAFFRSHCASAKVSKVAGVTHLPPTQVRSLEIPKPQSGRQGKPHPASLTVLTAGLLEVPSAKTRFRSPSTPSTAKSSLR
jgi:hypothetical protein